MINYTFPNISIYIPMLDNLLKTDYPSYMHLTYSQNNLTVTFNTALTQEVLDEVSQKITAHSQTYASSFEYLFDTSHYSQESEIEMSRKLLHDWMRKNKLEGMNVYQSLWVFSRFEELKINTVFGEKHVDLFKMFYSGAIPTVYYCMLQVEPDDMTQPYHWLTQARLDWVKTQIENYLSPGMIAYLQNLA